MTVEEQIGSSDATIRLAGTAAPARRAMASSGGVNVIGDDQTIRTTDALIGSGVILTGIGSESGTHRPSGNLLRARAAAGVQVLVGGAPIGLASGTYTVARALGRPSGEAEVFLVTKDGESFAFKYYFAHVKPNLTVLSTLNAHPHPAVLAVHDYGLYGGRTYEITEFASGGTLDDADPAGRPAHTPMRDEARVRQVITQVASGLAHLHGLGITHNDIKPANLLLASPSGDVRIGDFGLAAQLGGASRHVTAQNRTVAYAAPEIYRTVADGDLAGQVLIGKEVDYYALGVTLLQLWLGRNPFEGMSEFLSMNHKAEGNVAIPSDMPVALARLIRGLITVVPKRRWGASQVERWLRGEHVELDEDVHVSAKRFPALNLGDIDATGREAFVRTPQELADVLLKDPQRGIQYLYQGTILEWVRPVDPPLHSDLRHLLEQEYPVQSTLGKERSNREAAALNKAVYILDPGRPFRTRGGRSCSTSSEIGSAVEAERDYYLSAISDELDPMYLFFEARKQATFADLLRSYARKITDKRANAREQAFNEIVLSLQDWQTLRLDGQVFENPLAILAAPAAVQDRVAEQLAAGDQTKTARWLAAVMRDDLTWSTRLALWRRLARKDRSTLAFLLDPRAPFDFLGTPVSSVDEFVAELEAQLDRGVPSSPLLDASSAFARDAETWLLEFATRSNAEPDSCLGYAEVLQQYAERRGDRLGPLKGSIQQAIVTLVERRFREGGSQEARRAGVATLAQTAAGHPLGALFSAARSQAEQTLDAERRKRSVAEKRLKASQTMWLGIGGGAAIVAPMLAAFLAGPLNVAYLPLIVWVIGAAAMGHGLYRAVSRESADGEARGEEARFVTLILGGGLLVVVSVIVFVMSVVSGAGGFMGNVIDLLLACGASAGVSYGLGHLASYIVGRWQNAADRVRAMPPARDALNDREYAQVLDDVAAQWTQSPGARRPAMAG